MRQILASVGVCVVLASPLTAQTVLQGPLEPYSRPAQGTAEDLDSILVDGFRVRLTNIDNLDLSAEDTLRALTIIEQQLGGLLTICDLSDAEGSRYAGTCRIGETDVGDWFVAAGFAAYTAP
ncbi:MAG: hypothetical protein AAFQ36_11145 [Pseudomonadota bacterium]